METETYYYEIVVASSRYHKPEPLTYSYHKALTPGIVVTAQLRQETVMGFVFSRVVRPKFNTKPLLSVLPLSLPPEHLPLYRWICAYYPAPHGLIAGLFTPSFLAGLATSSKNNLPGPKDTSSVDLPPLTKEQIQVLEQFTAMNGRSMLLHGDTGTGKTRLYLELARQNIAAGKSVLVLTPEIGLTPQLTDTFTAYFGDRCVLTHSRLTAKERRNAWSVAADGTPRVVLGTRSALFSPLKNIGLIVIDEAHDNAYKQEQAPYYLASRVAAKLAELHHAKLILGTATPAIADYYLFEQKGLSIARMTTPAVGTLPVEVSVVNLRDKASFSRSPWVSDTLIAAIEDSLRHKRQSLLFLNRRGTARLTLCQACSWQRLCDNCDLPATMHADEHLLRCHTCGLTMPVPTSCPSCGSTDILFKSIGTKTIYEVVAKLFPGARLQRFDSDLKNAELLSVHYDSVRRGDADIIIGTQMITKGLDLPLLSVVGVIMADTSLSFPDYTAGELSYQMITQVIGRVGRGHGTSKIIIQTYNEQNSLLVDAIKKDFKHFYTNELLERKQFNFPPFCHILKISASRKQPKAAENAIAKLRNSLLSDMSGVDLGLPTPSFIEKSHGLYHWQCIIKAKRRSDLVDIISRIPSGYLYDLDPINLL